MEISAAGGVFNDVQAVMVKNVSAINKYFIAYLFIFSPCSHFRFSILIPAQAGIQRLVKSLKNKEFLNLQFPLKHWLPAFREVTTKGEGEKKSYKPTIPQ